MVEGLTAALRRRVGLIESDRFHQLEKKLAQVDKKIDQLAKRSGEDRSVLRRLALVAESHGDRRFSACFGAGDRVLRRSVLSRRFIRDLGVPDLRCEPDHTRLPVQPVFTGDDCARRQRQGGALDALIRELSSERQAMWRRKKEQVD